MQQNEIIERITSSDYYHQSVVPDVPQLVAAMAAFMQKENEAVLAVTLCMLIDIQNIMRIKAGLIGGFNEYTRLARGEPQAVDACRDRFLQFGLPESYLTRPNFILALKEIIWRHENAYTPIAANSALLTHERITPFVELIKLAMKSER